ncbi:MAG TPA: histidine kinase [Flavipsychrobacter sp.]|nr:histidine kinase [Flavipsychrobacter sp.]
MLWALLTLYPLLLVARPLFNLNVGNGLPTNHVYSTIVDRYGYLWMATAKGVVKYNGYSIKLFNVSSGISNADVWMLFEDSKGRIWLINISNQLGYIDRDKYHKVHVDDPTYIYPSCFINHKKGVAYLSGNNGSVQNLCVEQNDSIKTYCLSSKYGPAYYYLTRSKQLIIWPENAPLYNGYWTGTHLKFRKMGKYPRDHFNLVGDYLAIKNRPEDRRVKFVDILHPGSVNLEMELDGPIELSYFYKEMNTIITGKHIYILDSKLQKLEEFAFDTLQKAIAGAAPKYINMIKDKTWGRCLTTTNKGMYMLLPESKLHKETRTIKGIYVGRSADSVSYFWEEKNKTLTSLSPTGKQMQTKYPNLANVEKIAPLKGGTSYMLTARQGLFHFSGETFTSYFSGHSHNLREIDKTLKFQTKQDSPPNTTMINDCLIDSNKVVYAAMTGYGYAVFKRTNDSVITTLMDNGRYDLITYHPRGNFYMLYGNMDLLIHKGNQLYRINSKTLADRYGMDKIEKIVVDDTHGYIFIKTSSKLWAYDLSRHFLKPLFEQYNLNNATIHVYCDKIIVAGRFGVAYSKILPGMRFMPLSTCINIKGAYYHTVNSSFMIKDLLCLDTDKGIYSISVKDTVSNSEPPPYKLFLSSDNYHGILTTGDTITLEREEPEPSFDFINPYGAGTIRYDYTIDGRAAVGLAQSERLLLPVLQSGKYHVLQLTVKDDIWKTKPYKIYLYIQPYWWQTGKGQVIIIISGLLGIALLSVITIFSTKHILSQKHKKQHRYMELELKSIYAQLNPHFIFNTLTNIIYFIRKDKNKEAYRALTTFSKLLRSYIQSSREKWISVADEAENLNNYILLQQSRYDDCFDYTLSIAGSIDAVQTRLPSLLIQPIVENAIEHGLQPKGSGGNLTIQFEQPAADSLVITIDDNGVGRKKRKQQQNGNADKRRSFGSDLVNDLVTVFENYEDITIDIRYIDKQLPQTGTTVILSIKYQR